MKTTINQSLSQWVLCISQGEQVIRSWTFESLGEALDTAFLLQLHIDNEDTLLFNQYGKRGY